MIAFTYSDLFYADGPLINVRAMVSVVSAEEGGHRVPSPARWRPNHNFGVPEGRSFYIGQVDYGTSDLNPGDTREVLVQFFDGPGLREHLHPGRTWRVQEGPALVATAKVIEVVGEIECRRRP